VPSRFPNLHVNGTSVSRRHGTNIPPHNLTEVIDACICVLDNPDATLDDLMEHIKGPDFPTKGIILGRMRHPRGLRDRPRQDRRAGEGGV
jgi:DNA gyrase subunit A